MEPEQGPLLTGQRVNELKISMIKEIWRILDNRRRGKYK